MTVSGGAWLLLLSPWMKSYGVTIQMKPLQQCFHIDRGYYMAVRRYKISLRVLKNIS